MTLSSDVIAAGISESDTSPSLSWTVEGPSILDELLNFFLFLGPDFVILELIQHLNLPLPSRASELTNTRPSSTAARPSHYAFSTGGQPMCIYGDPAYPLRVHLQGPFQDVALTPQMEMFHAPMSSVRVSVE